MSFEIILLANECLPSNLEACVSVLCLTTFKPSVQGGTGAVKADIIVFFVLDIKSNQSFHIKCIVTPGLFVGILNYVKELPFYFNFAEDSFQKWMSNYAKGFSVSLEIIWILSLYLFM